MQRPVSTKCTDEIIHIDLMFLFSTLRVLWFSSETERVKSNNRQFLTKNVCLFFVLHIMFFLVPHTEEKYKELSQLELLHMLAHPHLNPSHHQVYFYPPAHSALYFTYSLCSVPYHCADFFTFPHQLKFSSLLLCFSRPLSSLYDFPHPRQSF